MIDTSQHGRRAAGTSPLSSQSRRNAPATPTSSVRSSLRLPSGEHSHLDSAPGTGPSCVSTTAAATKTRSVFSSALLPTNAPPSGPAAPPDHPVRPSSSAACTGSFLPVGSRSHTQARHLRCATPAQTTHYVSASSARPPSAVPPSPRPAKTSPAAASHHLVAAASPALAPTRALARR